MKNRPEVNSKRIVEWETSRVTKATRAKAAARNHGQVTGNVPAVAATTLQGGRSASNAVPANQQMLVVVEALVEAKVAPGTLVLGLVVDDDVALLSLRVNFSE